MCMAKLTFLLLTRHYTKTPSNTASMTSDNKQDQVEKLVSEWMTVHNLDNDSVKLRHLDNEGTILWRKIHYTINECHHTNVWHCKMHWRLLVISILLYFPKESFDLERLMPMRNETANEAWKMSPCTRHADQDSFTNIKPWSHLSTTQRLLDAQECCFCWCHWDLWRQALNTG